MHDFNDLLHIAYSHTALLTIFLYKYYFNTNTLKALAMLTNFWFVVIHLKRYSRIKRNIASKSMAYVSDVNYFCMGARIFYTLFLV